MISEHTQYFIFLAKIGFFCFVLIDKRIINRGDVIKYQVTWNGQLFVSEVKRTSGRDKGLGE